MIAAPSAGLHGSLADDDPAEDAIHPASLRGMARRMEGGVDADPKGAARTAARGGLPTIPSEAAPGVGTGIWLRTSLL